MKGGEGWALSCEHTQLLWGNTSLFPGKRLWPICVSLWGLVLSLKESSWTRRVWPSGQEADVVKPFWPSWRQSGLSSARAHWFTVSGHKMCSAFSVKVFRPLCGSRSPWAFRSVLSLSSWVTVPGQTEEFVGKDDKVLMVPLKCLQIGESLVKLCVFF